MFRNLRAGTKLAAQNWPHKYEAKIVKGISLPYATRYHAIDILMLAPVLDIPKGSFFL